MRRLTLYSDAFAPLRVSVRQPMDKLIITGGNLPVLLNRLRLFGLPRLLAGRTVVGWSAGAMVLQGTSAAHFPQISVRGRSGKRLSLEQHWA